MPENSIQKLVIDTLDKKGVNYKLVHHAAVHTIEEMDNLSIEGGQYVVKNLFLRDDKKKRFFLVVLKQDRIADLKMLRDKLGCRPLGFASEEYLKKYLNIEKGSVTPFGIE